MPAEERRGAPPVWVLGASVMGVAFAVSPAGPVGVIDAFLAAVLVTIAAVDIRTMRIPNRIVLPATVAVLAADLLFLPRQAMECLIAAAAAGAVLLLPNLINSSVLGMGDVKLAVLLGAALGWGVIGAIEIAFVSIFPFALAVLVRRRPGARTTALPFGPFMAFGALVVLIVPRLPGLGG